jgi:hypothetical protein
MHISSPQENARSDVGSDTICSALSAIDGLEIWRKFFLYGFLAAAYLIQAIRAMPLQAERSYLRLINLRAQ